MLVPLADATLKNIRSWTFEYYILSTQVSWYLLSLDISIIRFPRKLVLNPAKASSFRSLNKFVLFINWPILTNITCYRHWKRRKCVCGEPKLCEFVLTGMAVCTKAGKCCFGETSRAFLRFYDSLRLRVLCIFFWHNDDFRVTSNFGSYTSSILLCTSFLRAKEKRTTTATHCLLSIFGSSSSLAVCS